jgi:ABC-2 type transport system permease protein
MKLQKIFRFELAYQLRRLPTLLSFIAVGLVAFLFVRGNFLADAMYADFYINSPFVIAVVTVFVCLFWLLVAAVVTGEVAARDPETRMDPLSYTTPVSKFAYLGGRFLAAIALHLGIMLAVPLGIMLSVYMPGVDAEVVGPFRPEAYLTAYCYIAIPNVFIGTAIQFTCATLSRRALASYLGSVLLFVVVYGGTLLMFYFGGRKEVAALLDAFGQLTILDVTLAWSTAQKSTQLISMEGYLLWSRIIWVGIAISTLAFTYFRFQFAHYTVKPWWRHVIKGKAEERGQDSSELMRKRIMVPQVQQTFGLKTYFSQTLAIAGTSFKTIAKSLTGIPLLLVIAILTVVIVPEHMYNMGTPLLPRTGHLLTFLTTPLTNFFSPWIIIPLLVISYTGELVWRERKAGLGEISEAAPVPELVFFSGRYLGLCLILVVWMVLLMVAGLAVQVRMGYYEFEPGLYAKVLFGLQLPEYLLFALLALVIQGLMKQKYVGHMATVLAYAVILFSDRLGISHHLLVYGSGPGWKYDDMRGFAPTLGPWIWFKLYWVAWALLLVVVARLLWVRGMEGSFKARVREAGLRFTQPTKRIAAIIAGLVLALGGFIFYNTNVLNKYANASSLQKLRAEYERMYGRYKHVPQPEVSGTRLYVELYPKRKEVNIRGSFKLVNTTSVAIDTIHVATIRHAKTGVIEFDRKARVAILDDEHGYRSYALEAALKPGDSIELRFEVQVKPRGFSNRGADATVVDNGSYFRNKDGLPAIGYQSSRELLKPGERRAEGLPARPVIPTVADAAASEEITGGGEPDMSRASSVSFEAIVSTEEDQTAIAPGSLRRTWTKSGRRYFEYVNAAPLGDEFAIFSARYAKREEQWKPEIGKGMDSEANAGKSVAIQLYYHPEHAANVDRLLRSVRASLNNYSREFGMYPFSYVRLIENPVRGMGAHAEATTIDYGQGFSLFNPADDPKGLDLPFAILAHEMAHQWWGAQLSYAFAEGAGLLTESPAWYSAIGVVEETYGREHMHRLMRFFRQPHPIPPIRQSVPLLQGKDPYAAYRKGPFALHCLSEYMGKERVNLAYRRLIEKQKAGLLPAATSMHLYRELQAVTPDTLQYLLHDLFAANTFWEMKTKRVSAKQNTGNEWQITLLVQARKVVVDPNGIEAVFPMNEWVEIGAFGQSGEGRDFGKPLYLQKHRIHAGEQTITIKVPGKPADAGIDPYHLLIDIEPYDNVERVEIEK